MTEQLMALEWVDGVKVIRPMTEEELARLKPTPEMVNAHRDRLLTEPFEFNGHRFQRDAVSVQRINGAVLMAMAAMTAGASPHAPLWVNGGPFSWITLDNTVVQMTPAEVVAFGMACAEVETRLVFAAKRLREMPSIPEDFTADEYWQ